MLSPPRALESEWALEWMEDDELLEVTPQTLRLRKRILAWSQRKRRPERSGWAAGWPNTPRVDSSPCAAAHSATRHRRTQRPAAGFRDPAGRPRVRAERDSEYRPARDRAA